MSEELKKVLAGDIIKASQWNLVIDALLSQDGRIKVLESAVSTGGGPVILALDPPGDVTIGAELKIIGMNFGLAGLVAVTIQGVSQQIKDGSKDDLVLVDVKGIINLPADRICDLIVSNQKGATPIRKIKLVDPPPSTLLAQLAVQPITPPPAAPTSPGQSIFLFPVQAMTNMAATYTLTPSVTTASPAGWKAEIVDVGGNPSATEIQIPQTPVGQSVNVDVRVKVTIPGSVPNQTDFQVGMEIKSKTAPPQTGSRFGGFKTNVVAPLPSTDIQVSLGSVVIPPAANDASGLLIKPDNTKKVTAHFTVTTKDFGAYEVLPLSVTGDPGNRFTVTLKLSDPKFTTDINNPTEDVIIDVKGSLGVNADATLVVRVAKQSDHTVFGEIQHPLHIRP
jgi:hypothetical protein